MKSVTFWCACSVLLAHLTFGLPVSQAATDSRPTTKLVGFLAATANPDAAGKVEEKNLQEVLAAFPKDEVTWPNAIFIAAELHRMNGKLDLARSEYQQLAEWGADNARNGGWGGSGLAVFAIWRWLTLLNTQTPFDAESATRALEAADSLLSSRFAKGVFRDSVLESIPNLEVEISRELATAAVRAGLEEQAINLFLDYLKISNGEPLTETEEGLLKTTFSEGYGSEDHVNLLRGKRFFNLNDNAAAQDRFKAAEQSGNPQLRAEAGYYLVEISRRLDRSCPNVQKLIVDLDPVIRDLGAPDITQLALRLRSMLRDEPLCRDSEGYISDLATLVARFPDGEQADNALYLLGRHYERQGNLDQAFGYYAKLRAFKGANDYENFARSRPAWLLYARRKPGDLEAADALFKEIIDLFPDGDLYLAALFWRGRIAADLGRAAEAQAHFQEILEQGPYSYYAIRARMHLNIGEAASSQLSLDPKTRDDLQRAFKESKIDAEIDDYSLYSQRLRVAIDSGLYQQAATAIVPVPGRELLLPLKTVPLTRIDSEHAMARLAVLLSARQDVLAAKDLNKEPTYLLKLAGALGQTGGDWPMALRLIHGSANSISTRWRTQKQEPYLATAYPKVFENEFGSAASKYKVPASLLYAVAMHESHFDSNAVSPNEAAGLFQFIPRTFWSLNEKWKMLPKEDESARKSYLFQPSNSVELGARWFGELLLENHAKYRGKVVLALMEHNAGAGQVRDWLKVWTSQGRLDDIEFLIDTIMLQDTRRLTREIVGTMLIIDASGLYEEQIKP